MKKFLLSVLGLVFIGTLFGIPAIKDQIFFYNSLARAKEKNNPYDAYRSVKRDLDEFCPDSKFSPCYRNSVKIYVAEREYFTVAATSGNNEALRELFVEKSMYEYGDLKNQLKPIVLEKAKTSKNADLFATAAHIFGDSELGVIDTTQQIEYLKLAWKAGDVNSAGKLASIYANWKNIESAYYWSLRCIQTCHRVWNLTPLNILEKDLTQEQILNLQHEAADPNSNK